MILRRLRGAAGPAQLPGEDDSNPDAQFESIPNETRVRWSFNLSFPTHVLTIQSMRILFAQSWSISLR